MTAERTRAAGIAIGNPELAQAPLATADFLTVWLPVVLRWCSQLGGRGVDAEGAAGDVLIIALRRATPARSPSRWLFGITRRVLHRHRALALLTRWLVAIRHLGRVVTAPGRGARSEGERIQDTLDRLSVADREILVLALVEDRPDTQIADMLGVPADTLPKLRRAACARLLLAAGPAVNG